MWVHFGRKGENLRDMQSENIRCVVIVSKLLRNVVFRVVGYLWLNADGWF